MAVRALAPQTIGETARRHLLTQLQNHYRDYTVSIRRGHFDPKTGLVFEDLRIWDNGARSGRLREMVRIDRITLVSDVHPERLLDKQNPLETQKILLDGVHANVWLDEGGTISLTRLMPMPSFGPCVPRLEMRRIAVRLFGDDPRQRPVDATLSECMIDKVADADGNARERIQVRGSTDFADDVFVVIDRTPQVTDVRCAVKRAFLSRDLLDRLPSAWGEQAKQAQDLQFNCDAQLAFFQRQGHQPNYRIKVNVHDGRFMHTALPQPINELRGIVIVDPSGITVESSQGMLGDSVVRSTGKLHGLKWPCRTELSVSARGLLLNNRLAASLPMTMQRSWNRFEPYGRVDVDAKLTCEQGHWTTNGTMDCKGVDVRYEKVPYPIENLVGRVVVQDNLATAELISGRIGGNRIQCAFRLPTKPGVTLEKSFVMASDGPIPIDNTLLASLSPRGGGTTPLETFVRSLQPRGSIQLTSAVLTTDIHGRPSRKVEMKVMDGHLRYDKFKYPLYNIAGDIRVIDDVVTISGFRGTNADSGVIRCDGAFRMAASRPVVVNGRVTSEEKSSSELALKFHAADLRMDDSLRSSLPDTAQTTWDAISPSGVLDDLTVTMRQQGAGTPLDLDITAQEFDSDQVTNRSLSLRPVALPYRIDVTEGKVHYDGKRVLIESIRGRHDASTLSADGQCVQSKSGRWELSLNVHSGSRLHTDAELIAALPGSMREAMRRLQLRGPISIRGRTRLAMPDQRYPMPAIQWDLGLQLEGNRIGDVGPVHSLRGEIRVKGVRDEVGIRAVGDVALDSMHFYDLQITGIRGPFAIKDDQLLLGQQAIDSSVQPVSRELDQAIDNIRPAGVPNSIQAGSVPASAISGSIFDGVLETNGIVTLSSGQFDVGMSIQDGKVPILLADFGQGDNELRGSFRAQAQLQGNLGRPELLKGSGTARLRDANLYKLPFIVQLLNLLRVTPTEDVAFTDGEVDYSIFGEILTFNDLQIWGDLVALNGGGTMNRRRELDLTFNSRVSPQNTFTKIIRPLQSQRYTLWTIDVRGTLQNPTIERRALEGVGETIGALFSGQGGNE
ncbi:MAG: AsmA-like C-terminal region-containing protein [Planctomycetota bacterium]